jgi:signal transduction histidine kinase
VREVARSQPTFHRRLLFATGLFTLLFVADLFVIGNLAFRDLGHTVIDAAFDASLRALEVPPPPVLADAEDDPAPPPRFEDCPPGVPQTLARGAPCRVPPAQPAPGSGIFGRLTRRWQRVVVNTRGEVIWRGFVEESRVGPAPAGPGAGEPAAGAAAAPAPWHPAAGGEWEFGDSRKPVIAIRQPAGPGGPIAREVGIPSDLIEQELAELRKSLMTKLWIGSGAAVLILLVAFLYVLRLLHRTRLLEAQAQMDDRLAYVGALAAGLAHEIRNPLNVLSMNLQMLEEEIAERGISEKDETRQYLSALQGEIRRLSSLVNNFLSYARPNQPRFESRDLNDILREICRLMQPEFDTRQLTLRRDLSPYLPPVDLDEAQIRQAVMNILHNATQILKPGGTVLVESRIGPQGEVVVAIQDDGPGVRPEDRDRIFQVFYSGRRGGTGLGLPIAARILEAHGGAIRVEDAPGRGARFVLTLPRRHHPAAPATAAAASPYAATERG